MVSKGIYEGGDSGRRSASGMPAADQGGAKNDFIYSRKVNCKDGA